MINNTVSIFPHTQALFEPNVFQFSQFNIDSFSRTEIKWSVQFESVWNDYLCCSITASSFSDTQTTCLFNIYMINKINNMAIWMMSTKCIHITMLTWYYNMILLYRIFVLLMTNSSILALKLEIYHIHAYIYVIGYCVVRIALACFDWGLIVVLALKWNERSKLEIWYNFLFFLTVIIYCWSHAIFTFSSFSLGCFTFLVVFSFQLSEN